VPPRGRPAGLAPACLGSLGLPASQVRGRLAGVRVAVVAPEGLGAPLGAVLTARGVGELVLVDPAGCQPDHLDALAAGCHLLAGCFDAGSGEVDVWLDARGLAHRVPVLHAWLDGPVALIGPLFVPGRTACWACWRARILACGDGRARADAARPEPPGPPEPGPPNPPGPPELASAAAGTLAEAAAEAALGHLLAPGAPGLAGRVRELDLGTGRDRVHTVLAVPGCPVCDPVGPAVRTPPPLADLVGPASDLVGPASGPGGDLLDAVPSLVDPWCGVVTRLERLPKDPREPVLPHVVVAELADLDGAGRTADRWLLHSGKGTTLAEARRGALGEAVERYAGAWRDRDGVVRAPREELDGALDPRALVLYGPGQYATLPYAPYSERTVMGWVAGRSLVSGARVLVPALAVSMDYPPASPEERIFPTTSTGLAAGTSLAGAVLAGALEVLERDAFVIAWLNRLPGQRVDPLGHPDSELVDLVGAYRRHGVEVRLHRLPSDHPCHVFLCLGMQRHGEGPPVTVGLGADLDPASAARKAVLEMGQARPFLHMALRVPALRARSRRLGADPRLVATADDHALLYADPRALGAFEFLECGSPVELDWRGPAPAGARAGLRRLVEHLSSQGGDLLYCDLTLKDVGGTGLHVVRVLVPGFQPLDFGWKAHRLGGTRLYELPHRLGLTDCPTTPEQLDHTPHPLA